MNSRINKNALQNFFEAAGKENVNTLIRSGLAYQKALQTGNQEAIYRLQKKSNKPGTNGPGR